ATMRIAPTVDVIQREKFKSILTATCATRIPVAVRNQGIGPQFTRLIFRPGRNASPTPAVVKAIRTFAVRTPKFLGARLVLMTTSAHPRWRSEQRSGAGNFPHKTPMSRD